MNSPNSEKRKGKQNALELKQVVEINVGQSWLEHLRQLVACETHKASFDFCELFDLVDIIVAGVNVTASIESEYIIPFFSRLCTALNRLSNGETEKAIVEFQKEPWDFVLCRKGEVLFLSVISIDNEMRIVCLDQPINFVSFVTAVRRETQAILDAIFSLAGLQYEAGVTHPEIERLVESLSEAVNPIYIEPKDEIFDITPNTLGVSFPGFSLSVFFEPNTAFFQYQPEIAFDLHTLLVPGEVQFEFEDTGFSIGEHVFITLNTLLKNCHEWMALFSESRIVEHEIHAPFHLRLRSTESGFWEIGTTALNRVDPRSLLESILSMCLNFSQKLESLNPTIVVNQRFSDFQELTVDLKNYWEDLCEKDLFNDEPESFLSQFAGLKPNQDLIEEPHFRFDFAKLRAIHPAHQWSFQADRISFSNIFTSENALIVPSKKGVARVALDFGEIEWQIDTEGASSPVFRENNIFLQVRQGMLSSFDLSTGQEIQRVEEGRSLFAMHSYHPPSGRSVVQDRVGPSGTTEDQMLVFSTEQGIVGRCKNSLEESWFYPIKRKIGADAVTAGPIYTVLSNGGVLHAINPITGERLWKVKLTGSVVGPPHIYRSRIFVCQQSNYRFQLSCKLAFTGREAWTFEEEGLFAGELFFRGDQCIFSIEKNGGVEIVGLCLKTHSVTWRIPISSRRGYYPSFVFFKDQAIAKSNSSETLCFDTETGRILWRVTPDPSPFPHTNLKLVVVRDAFISHSGRIEIRSLENGELIRDFGDTTIEAKYFNVFHPLSIVTGEPGDRIDQDRLVSFTIQHFLAMVDLPKDP